MVLAVRTRLPVQETQETWVQSLAWEDPLEEEMATYSSILAWRIPWTEYPHRLLSMGSQRIRNDLSALAQHSTWLVEALDDLCGLF